MTSRPVEPATPPGFSPWLGAWLRRHLLLLGVATVIGLAVGVVAAFAAPKRYASAVSLRVGQLGGAGLVEPLERVAARVHERLRALEPEERCDARAVSAGTVVDVHVVCDDAQLAMERLDAGVRPVLAEHRAIFDAAAAQERARLHELRAKTGALNAEIARLPPDAPDEVAGALAERLRGASAELAAVEATSSLLLTYPTELVGEVAPGLPQEAPAVRLLLGALLGLLVGALVTYLRDAPRRARR